MASPYQSYPGSPREPSTNIPYASVGAAPTYPYPPHTRYDGSAASLDSDSSTERDRDKPPGPGPGVPKARVAVDVRAVNRTPSPTPSEAKELAKNSVFDWDAMLKWRYWIRRDWLCASRPSSFAVGCSPVRRVLRRVHRLPRRRHPLCRIPLPDRPLA